MAGGRARRAPGRPFFVATGEVWLPMVRIGGKNGGEVLRLEKRDEVEIESDAEWAFPLAFAEVVPVDLRGCTWARLEVGDVAANGAFTQPVWIEK